MKPRQPGFLADDQIDHNSEIFDYIQELHGYLWRVVHIVQYNACGKLNNYLDGSIEALEGTQREI